MSLPRENAGTVLGKRSHQTAQVEVPNSSSSCDFDVSLALPTPDSTPNPKRAKTLGAVLDGDHNKENVPPFVLEAINASISSPRVTRSLRRTNTMIHGSSSRPSTPRRHASTSSLRQAAAGTPATSLSHLSLATPPPSPPVALLPLHVRARALLRPTCNDGPQMAGREQEKAAIEAFILGFLRDAGTEESSALYISGSPGTGKTALVNAVLGALSDQLQDQGAQVLVVNCMALDGVDSVWDRLAELFVTSQKASGRGRKPKDSPQQAVQKALVVSDRKCIVVLDEMDHIASSTQTLSPLFTLAYAHSASLRLIGIANTHTLTSSSSTTISVQSLAGVKTLHFAPYTSEQLLNILRARLAPLSEDVECSERVKKFLPNTPLTLLSKKIASQTGDVRAVFEVLRGAIDIAVNVVSSTDLLNAPPPAVTPSHIIEALKAYSPAGKTTPSPAASAGASVPRKGNGSETVVKVRELGLQQRLVLLAALLAVKSAESGVPLNGSSPTPSASRSPIKRTQSSSLVQPSSLKPSFDIGQLHGFYTTILSRAENGVFKPVSRSEFGDLAGVLEVVGLLTLTSGSNLPSTPRKSGKKAFSRSMSFTGSSPSAQDVLFVAGVRLDEVVRGLGLGLDDTPTDAREEEVRAIYQREQARIAREAKARGQNSRTEFVGFEDAMED